MIKTTPLAPLAPYTAVAAASFKISIFSISFGLMKFIEVWAFPDVVLPSASEIGLIGIPSST